jgi:hypothetical protein
VGDVGDGVIEVNLAIRVRENSPIREGYPSWGTRLGFEVELFDEGFIDKVEGCAAVT